MMPRNRRAMHSPRGASAADERYRALFERSAIPLLEADISRLRLRLAQRVGGGTSDLRSFLDAEPGLLGEAMDLIEVTEANRAALRLFEAESKQQVLGPLSRFLSADSRGAIVEVILAIAKGGSASKRNSGRRPSAESS